IRPAMANQLIDALQKVAIGFHLHVERRGSKWGRVQPCPGLRGCHGASINVVRRRRPAGGAQASPLMAFSFAQIRVAVARQRDGWSAVSLYAQQRAVSFRPVMERRKKSVVEQFRQRLAPIAPNSEGFRADVANESR